jgi:hypothetical protein
MIGEECKSMMNRKQNILPENVKTGVELQQEKRLFPKAAIQCCLTFYLLLTQETSA